MNATTNTATETRADRRRREIVEAAFDLFAQRGYHETSISDMAQRLRMSHGTFYRYFDNKRDILDTVVADVTARLTAVLAAENAPEAAATLAEYRTQVERIVGALVQVVDHDPRIVPVLLEATAVDRRLGAQVLALIEEFTKTIERYLENGIRHGYLDPGLDTRALARALNSLLLGGTLQAVSHAPAEREALVKASIRVMFDGVSR